MNISFVRFGLRRLYFYLKASLTAVNSSGQRQRSSLAMEGYYVVFIVGSILGALGCLLASSVLIFNVKFINLRFIRMSSPRVNVFLVVGTLILYTSGILMAFPSQYVDIYLQTSVNQGRCWLLTVGFTITFGSMLVKGWRVHRLFQYPRASTVTIKDGSLFGGVVVLLFLDLTLLTSWQLIDPIICEDVNMELSPSANSPLEEAECTSAFYSIWMTVLLLYKYIIIIMSCYVGWQIRHITFPALDDSRCLLLSSGISLTLGGAVCIIMLLFPTNTLVLYAALSLSIWIGTTSTLFIIFLPKIRVVYRSQGLEPLMGSASKYVQQPVSNDVGTELVKILGENRYLKRKLEESDILVSHLKKRVNNSVSTDTESQQTSSANYSITSTTTTALTKSEMKRSKCFGCFSLCCEGGSQTMPAELGSPTDRDLSTSSIKNVDILTLPTVQAQTCHSYLHTPKSDEYEHEEQFQHPSRIIPVVTISHASPSRDCTSIDRANHQIVSDDAKVESAKATSPASCSDNLYINDIDLLCTIADTYDLGGDTDTLSYISNCLHNKQLWSLRRPTHHSSQILTTTAMLESDQLYPDSILSQKSSKQKQKSRKSHRRQSVATTSNVYMNAKGRPLIL